MSSAEKDIPGTVELLVDAICNLVLDAVTGSLQSVKQHCEDLAQYTNKVVLLVQDVALASRDSSFQVEVTGCINDIATTIEALVVAFNAIVGQPKEPSTQKEFALCSKNVGDAINRLVVATDTSFSNKILAAVEDAEAAASLLVASAAQGRDALMENAKASADNSLRLVKVATSCASATADTNKAKMLAQGSEALKGQSPALVVAARGVCEGSADSSQLRQAHSSLQSTFHLLREAAKIVPSFGKRFSDAFDYVRRFLELAQDMEDAARRLVEAVRDGNPQDVVQAARRAADIAKEMIAQAERALEKEADPVRRAQIQACIQELRDASHALLAAAKDAQQNPDDAAAMQRMENAEQHLKAVVKKMAALINPDDLEGKLFHTAQYLEDLCNHMMAQAPNCAAPKLMEHAKQIGAASVRLAKDADNLAASDAGKQVALQEAAGQLKASSAQELAAIKAFASNQQDQGLLDNLRGNNNNLCDRIHDLRVAAGLAAPRERGEQALDDAPNYEA